MTPRIDRVGQRFGRLVIRCFAGYASNWHPRWECVCDCGDVVVVQYGNLQGGQVQSCGCLKHEKTVERNTTHGLSGGEMTPTRLYRRWLNMRRRCFSPGSDDYFYYGGRGITICLDWADYGNFYSWAMANGYRDDLTIERIDNDGNYEPGNCKWVARPVQARNKRNNRLITFRGETKTAVEWAEVTGIDSAAIRARIDRFGWSTERALTIPAKTKQQVIRAAVY